VLEQGKKTHGHIPTHIVLVALEVLLDLGAMGGGWALLTGVIKFPPEWLRDPPSSTYAILGLALLVLVGGSSLVATMLMVVSAGGRLL
jgi:hypothetical protein